MKVSAPPMRLSKPNVWSWRILEKLGMREFHPPNARQYLRYARLTRRELVAD